MQRHNWRKSTYSATGNCVEAGSWRKSTYSGPDGTCVEAGHGHALVGVRDTQLGDASPVLEVSTAAWRAFLGTLK